MTTTPSAPPGTLQHGVSRREFPRHPVKQEKLHRAVAPTQGVGPGVAAEIDQGVEEEPDMDVLSELAPRFGCKELSNSANANWRPNRPSAIAAPNRLSSTPNKSKNKPNKSTPP